MPAQALNISAVLMVAAFLSLELRATPLVLGTFSPAICWCVGLASLQILSQTALLLCLLTTVVVRGLLWPASPSGAWKDGFVDFLPPALAAVLVHRFGWWTSACFLPVLAVPLPAALSYGLARESTAAACRWALKSEQMAMLALAPALAELARVHPALALLLWPAVYVLLQTAGQGDELRQRRGQHLELRRERKRVSLQEQFNEQTEVRQGHQQRLLDARADSFGMLETLAARALNEQQAVGEVLNALRQRNPAWDWQFFPKGETSGDTELVVRIQQVWVEGAPWILKREGVTRAAWPISGSGVFCLQASSPFEAETSHTLGVFFYYLNLCFERIRFQERLQLSLQRLQALLQGASLLASLLTPEEILNLLVERASLWTGRPCGARFGGLEVGQVGGSLFPLGPANFAMNAENMDAAELEAIRLWLVLGAGAIERCQAQATLQQNSKMAAIGQLAAGVAHELNTPLGAIAVALGLARQSLTKNPEKVPARLETARKSVEQMNSIISKLLNFSRASDGEHREIPLGEVLENAVQLVSHSYQTDSVCLEVADLSEETWVCGNGGELQQVIVNLLVNARLAVQGQPDALVRLGLEGGRLLVEDNGPGVSEENLERIFEPFFTTRQVGHGVGLGLAISREIVASHGGSINVSRSKRLGGACFEVALPPR